MDLDALDKALNLNETTIKIVFCERFDEKSNIWNLNRHRHDYIEIIYFIDGGANVEVSDESMKISLFDLIVYPAGVYHHEYVDMTKHQEIMCLGIKFPEEITLEHIMHIPDKDGKLKWLLECVIEEQKSNVLFSSKLSDLYLRSLLLLIFRYYENASNDSQDIVDIITQYIMDNFYQKITIKDLAHLVHVSDSYLIRLFKKRLNTTPIKYINKVKVEAAKRFLCTTNFTVEQISYKTGFSSPKYFSRIFKQFTNFTPSEFRNFK